MDYSAAQHITRIAIQGHRFYLEADMVVPAPAAYRSRVCDVLNRSDPFLVLTNVSLYPDGSESGAEPEYHEVLIVHKDQVQYAVPLD
jgi:hypothetical protein